MACNIHDISDRDTSSEEDFYIDNEDFYIDNEDYRLEPYSYEPEYSDSELNTVQNNEGNSHEDQTQEWRLTDISWCSCQNCRLMDTTTENRCCKEIMRVTDKMEEVEVDTCITDHPGFEPVCLNEWSLQVAYMAYKQQYGERDGAVSEKYRYTAYRQFVRWCWSYLGKHIRVTIPSCVVQAIRNKFPSQNYTGFKLPPLA